MGFTNVSWESRSTEQLARDLTDGPGPTSVGQAGAEWVRVANELASVSTDFDKIVERVRASAASEGSDAAIRRLEEFGKWLQAISLSAAANGQRAEQAAVANTVAIMAMPTVSEAVEAKAAHDMMASLAAYNGAILNGTFAEFDDAATADQANAAAVMQQYEEACIELANPWEQPLPPDVANGDALKAERDAKAAEEAGRGGGGGAGGAGGVPAAPLAPFRPNMPGSTNDPKNLQKIATTGGSGGQGMGGGYGPMAGAHGRGDNNREHESSMPAASLAGGGEPGAGVSDNGGSWLPAAQVSDAPFTVSNVSWGPNTSVFDELAVPAAPEAPSFATDPQPTLEQVSDEWVAPPVIGADRGRAI
ncbi:MULTISPECIES: PPE domain-containing protein [Mycolicibacterium]|uniref:PPE domain-containing protein n=1 Tax=Mycolicibacterium TaxID=1866885 RepID=UPI002623B353|nr:PPE domain-containing protein [Mycolicibacterium fortuitum]